MGRFRADDEGDGDSIFAGDADIEMAELEQAGRSAARKIVRMESAYLYGQKIEAAGHCPHGWLYPLKSLAATQCSDPRAGAEGWRCQDCGSALSDEPRNGGIVTRPCELIPHTLKMIPHTLKTKTP